MSDSRAPATVDLAVPEQVLAIGAHPDDIEFGCGATLAKWAAAGASVHLLVLTDGSKGSWDPVIDVHDLTRVRLEEQRAAAATLGSDTVQTLGAVDGELENGREERAAVCAVLRRIRPDVVLGHDPWKRYRLHPDHRRAGELTIDAIVAARDPLFFPEQELAPHRPQTLLLFEAEEVDHLERVEGFVDQKVAALLCHRSQWRSTMGIEADSPSATAQRDAFATRIVDEARDAARATSERSESSLAPVSPCATMEAEAFKRIDDL
ncbi:MAG TPA: PIG-L deacetylase family protein [Acidimicrobiia bacterium]